MLLKKSRKSMETIMQARSRRFFLVGALGAIAQLLPTAAWSVSSANAAEIIAAQLRRQGVSCSNPKDALPDLGNSVPHEKVWVLRCDEASYRVTLSPRTRARITPLCRDHGHESLL
jgi:hypothetical protein